MTQVVPLSDAKARLAGLVQAAEAGQVVQVSRHGKPVAVLLSKQAYSTLHQLQTSQAPGKSILNWRLEGRSGCHEDWTLPSDPSADQEIGLWRDRAIGRPVYLW